MWKLRATKTILENIIIIKSKASLKKFPLKKRKSILEHLTTIEMTKNVNNPMNKLSQILLLLE